MDVDINNEDKILCHLMIRKKLKKEEYKSQIIQKFNNKDNCYRAIYKTCCLSDSLFYGIIKYLHKKEKEEINTNNLRTYDLLITYDLYYQVPRIGIMGYNYKGIPLTKEEIEEDISPPYFNKVFIYEQDYATGIWNYYIYPCRHSKLFY